MKQSLKKRTRRETKISSTISTGLVNGAWYIQQGLIKGAEKAGQLINYGTPKIINHLQPADQPKEIPPAISRGFNTAKNVTGTAANVTGFIAGKVGSATMSLGQYLAPFVHKQGTKLLSTGFNMNEHKAHERMDGILTVAAGAVEGLATVYSGLEQSAGILGKNLTNNTVKIVEHKYGPSAGDLTAKSAAKSTGKSILKDYQQNHHHDDGVANAAATNLNFTNYNNPTLNPNIPSTSKDLM